MIEKIVYKKKLLALIVRWKYRNKKGITFFTPNNANQQFGYMKHKKEYIIKPHLHKKRNSYFYCIDGSVIFILRDNSGNFIEIESNPENRKMVFVPSGMASAHVNISEKPSQVLALADIAWKPNDNEMINVKFDEYDWKKWAKQ